jgi:ribosomal-protein-serine acetyltransferase
MVRVEDIEAHYARAKQAGAEILHPPADYPYGERQYTARDPGGHVWVFSQSIADVDPGSWGGTLFESTKTMMMAQTNDSPPTRYELPRELRGERVCLRPYAAGDGAVVHEAIEESRDHLRPWMEWTDSRRTVQDCETYVRQALARWITLEDVTLGMWDCSDGRYLGGIWLCYTDRRVPALEIGYWVRVSAQGRGYVTEAVTLLCRLAFSTFAAQRVCIQCEAANTRSANIARRLGFVHEATLRNHSRNTRGELTDTLIFALTPADYHRLPWSQA